MTKIILKLPFAIYTSLLHALFPPALDYEKLIKSVSLRGHYHASNAPMSGFVDTVEECHLAKKLPNLNFLLCSFQQYDLKMAKIPVS